MLSKTLRELESDGLIRRAEYLEVPVRVEYSITEKATKLQPILLQLIQWQMGCNANQQGEPQSSQEGMIS